MCATNILLLDTQSTIQEQPNALKLEHLNGHIRFQSVDFAYTHKPVLQNFNLDIEAGKIIAIVGQRTWQKYHGSVTNEIL